MHEEVINSLKKSKDYLSGEEISRSLNISRAAIWKNIEELRKKGYEIEAASHKGYRLLSTPDKILPWEIKYKLNTRQIGKRIICKERVDSTMDEAFRLGFEGAEEGTVVCAEAQTKGRGRMGRSWSSPKEVGVYMSLILRPTLSPRNVAKLTLLVAVAVCEALRKVSGLDIKIKWPNDLLVHGKKLVGILTELSAEVDRVKFVVVGLGVNVNAPQKKLPDEGTSLKIETKKKFVRVDVIKEILRSLDAWYGLMKKEGFHPIFSQWKKYASMLKKKIFVRNGEETIEGIALDLSEEGGLLVQKEDGKIIKILAGDISII